MENKKNQESPYILNRLKELHEIQCTKIAGVVGTGIHLYSTVINNDHFQAICEDFANERYLSGTLKATVPYMLPYAVSFYARKKAKKEAQGKINNLELKVKQLEEAQNK